MLDVLYLMGVCFISSFFQVIKEHSKSEFKFYHDGRSFLHSNLGRYMLLQCLTLVRSNCRGENIKMNIRKAGYLTQDKDCW
jgi:hypothetical protein